MNISAVSSNLNANKLTAKISKVVNPQVKTKPDVFTKSVENISQKSPKLSKTLRTLFIAATALLATSCATLRGGNFIYNEATERIEDVERFKKNNGIDNISEDTSTNSYGLYSCFDKNYIEKYGIENWYYDNFERLPGSCIFDKDDSNVSKIIRKYTNTSKCDSEHLPSHATPIYLDKDGSIKRLQVDNKPGVHAEDFISYLKATDRNYIIYLRDFDMDVEKFSDNMMNFIGQPYGYISAVQTVLPFDIDGGLHCSESYIKGIQDQGIFKKVNANKITPHTLLHLLVNKHLNNFKKEDDKIL